MANDTNPTDAWESLSEYGLDLDDPEQAATARALSLKDVHYQRVVEAAGKLGMNPVGTKGDKLVAALAKEGVFRGPVGDDTLYVRDGGETVTLNEYASDE